MKRDFIISGMSCAACSARVRKAVAALDGVTKADVNLLTGSMRVECLAGMDSAIINAVKGAGYGASVKGETAAGQSAGETRASEIAKMKARVIASFALLLPLMYVSMGHMLKLPLPAALSGEASAANFALTQFLLALPVMYVNRAYYLRGFGALWRKSPNMDTLIALGSAASIAYGVFAMYMINLGESGYMHELYFESAVMILALVNLGKYMEAVSKGKTGTALEKLKDLAPKTALIEYPDGAREIPAEDARPGDILRVMPGARVPADGVIIEGYADIDESAITGESMPAEKGPGDEVTCATINLTRFFRMRVTRAGEDTAFSRIIRLVEDAGAGKAPIARLADRVSGVFVPVVMGISIICASAWLLSGARFEFALARAISVLVISCPCALGLATPVAIMVGMGKGAQLGILMRSGEALEAAQAVNCAVMDKTGTLTRGEPAITRAYPVNISEAELMRLACALEGMSEHPLARAVVARARDMGVSPAMASDFEAVPGRGVKAVIDGQIHYGGNAAWMQTLGVDFSMCEREIEAMQREGETPLLFARGNAALGVMGAADEIKPTSKAAVSALNGMGVETVMLTGDNRRTAEAVAKTLGINQVYAGVLPADKASIISGLADKRVAMIGDGINDAPALKTARVGIAIGAGTDIAIESADIILMHSDPMDIAVAIRLSRAVMRNIKQNLFWAFFYNTLGIPVAAGALYSAFGIALSPMLAAALMSVSSLCVVTNALRLRAFAPADKKIKEETRMITLKIEGMMCAHCQARVQSALTALPGVKARVDHQKGEAQVTAPANITQAQLKKAVEDAGYKVLEVV